MISKDKIKEELIVLRIDISQELSKNYVTSKFRKLAKERHPDKKGGNKEEFQVLKAAYDKIIKFMEELEEHKDDEDLDTEFFMRNNFMKECTSSFVVYIQESLVDEWQKVLEKQNTRLTHKQ